MNRHPSWDQCLLCAALLLVFAVVFPIWTVPALLHRPGVPVGVLMIFGCWAVLLAGYGWRETRR